MLLIIGAVWVFIHGLCIIFFHNDIRYYAQGMAEYRTNNWKGRIEAFYMLKTVINEIRSVVMAILDRDIYGIIDELCDVCHVLITTFALLVFGNWMKTQPIYWLIYIICPVTGWKHGDRYRRYRCVRSYGHHNSNGSGIDHICVGDVEKIFACKRGPSHDLKEIVIL